MRRLITPCYAPTLPKPHYPSKSTITLASLVKGRWIDGKAQTVALLLSACDMPTLFILQIFLPSRRRDCSPSAPSISFSALSPSLFVLQSSVCLYGFAFALSHSLFVGERACPSRCTNPCHSHNPFKSTATLAPRPTLPKPHYPLLCTITLGSLVKGSWLATRLLLIINCNILRFYQR